MAVYRAELILDIVDVNGDIAQARLPVAPSTAGTLSGLAADVGTWAGLVTSISNGKVIRQSFSVLVDEAQFIVGTAPPTDAPYPTVTDGARMNFANNTGARMATTVPAPVEAVFGTHSNVVDPTVSAVAAFITGVEGLASDRAGNFFNLYKGGIKVGRRARKRRSALVP